jgi:hypothetical protein
MRPALIGKSFRQSYGSDDRPFSRIYPLPRVRCQRRFSIRPFGRIYCFRPTDYEALVWSQLAEGQLPEKGGCVYCPFSRICKPGDKTLSLLTSRPLSRIWMIAVLHSFLFHRPSEPVRSTYRTIRRGIPPTWSHLPARNLGCRPLGHVMTPVRSQLSAPLVVSICPFGRISPI